VFVDGDSARPMHKPGPCLESQEMYTPINKAVEMSNTFVVITNAAVDLSRSIFSGRRCGLGQARDFEWRWR